LVGGTGTWEIVKDGVEIRTNQITGLADMQKLPGATFTSTWIIGWFIGERFEQGLVTRHIGGKAAR
jgi:hypothetical protein